MKYLKLFIATLFIALISCSKDDVSKSDKVEDTKSVLLKISNMPITYSEGQPQVAAPISFTSGNLFFASAEGTILKHYTLTSDATSDKNINISSLSSGATIVDLHKSISSVYVVGNTPNIPTSGLISAIKDHTLKLASQSDIAKVNLYGAATKFIHVSDNKYKVSINIAPTVARIELTNIKASGVITGFQVAGIFIDNYYSNATVEGIVSEDKLINNGTDAVLFADNTAQYPTSLKPSVYDWYSPALASVSHIVKPTDGKVWSYNLFAYKSTVPRLIIRLKNITTTPESGISYTGDQFITIKGLKYEGVSLPHIESGKVYNIGEGAFTFDESVLAAVPNMNTIDVAVTVELASWEVINVTPDI